MIAIEQRIATELAIRIEQVNATVGLLNEGATVPFISRYRKEVTGSLDDTQLRKLHVLLEYWRELEARRETILSSIKEQGKLTPELEQKIQIVESKTQLEDLYLPYKPKRQTKAMLAIEAGLEPLAHLLWQTPETDPNQAASEYLNVEKGITEPKLALEGARQILMEQFSEDAELIGKLRDYCWNEGFMNAAVVDENVPEAQKYRDYFAYAEELKKMPSHRVLAILRGRKEGYLRLKITLGEETPGVLNHCELQIAKTFEISDNGRAADARLLDTVRWCWKFKVFTRLELEFISLLREAAELEAIHVFANNLKDLLLAAPAGHRVTLGLDPGIRTGVKVVVVDATGKLLQHTTIYPLQPRNQWDQSIEVLAQLCKHYNVDLISIGNGTGSRETDKLVMELMKKHSLKVQKIVVSEAGASVYSASELAAEEFPDLDVTLRGAVSIARRLQDPLAELVKIDPKSIGVGQYQHDVNQVKLARSLSDTVEDCVNAVGVDVNTASVPLLTQVSGLSKSLAKNIVIYRDENGPFPTREAIKAVPLMGKKAFEQAAGFLRITNGDNPLDASAVHPESYPIVEKILAKHKVEMTQVIGNLGFTQALNAAEFVDEQFGLPTITDIIKELEKPGRDPRPEFKAAQFQEGVEELKHLVVGMILEGCVTNVTNFGAFVDIGVHQDGLVHISELANTFVTDPRQIVKSGDIVKVRVTGVDLDRNRVALSMKMQGEKSAFKPKESAPPVKAKQKAPVEKAESDFALKLREAMKR